MLLADLEEYLLGRVHNSPKINPVGVYSSRLIRREKMLP